MVTALESKTGLRLLGDDAVDTVEFTLRRSSGSFESRRLQLLDSVPGIVGYYSEGSAALAADFYDDARDAARARGRFEAEAVVLDRTVKIRRGVAWASEPLSVDDDAAALGRLAEIVRSEITRPYRDTVLENRRRDPETVGWMRLTSPSACSFCKFMAAKGAVYRKDTATFAAHDSCQCTAVPAFRGQAIGPEASALQYVGSKRRRSPAEKARLREAITDFEATL